MGYDVAASLTALVHLAFLVFVVFGAALGTRNRWWRWLHLAAMAYGVLIEAFYWSCPLTVLENYLRRRAGRSAYDEPFIAHYINQLVYVDLPQWSLILAAVAVLVWNIAIYAYYRRHARRGIP